MTFGCGDTTRLVCMLLLVVGYFFVEICVGITIHSIALVADSFHMLSDCLALVVGIIAARIAKWPRSSKNTFGWQRAEVMGSLINTVFLITLCFTIFLRAIERFAEPHEIDSPNMMVWVGAGGLAVNILGLFVVGGHSHEASKGRIHMVSEAPLEPSAFGTSLPINNTEEAFLQVHPRSSTEDSNGLDCSTDNRGYPNSASERDNKVKMKHSHSMSSSMNMRAVFLHVLADFFGSIIVVVSALILWLVPGEVSNGESLWKLYVDPLMSLLMVTVILSTSIPLVYKAVMILLQSVPSEICLKNLKMCMENIDGIHKVHDLHVWRLQSNCIIGTVHIRCANLPDYLNVARQVKQLFHEFDIHCTTIQPEFEEQNDDSASQIDYQACVLDCGPDKNCQSDTCCPVSILQSTNMSAPSQPLVVSSSNTACNVQNTSESVQSNVNVIIPIRNSSFTKL